MTKPDRLIIDDVEQVKMLTQPARMRAVEELFNTQVPHTATRLATLIGITPSAMSYHLRELERQGLVRRAGASDDARERFWEAPAMTYEIIVSDYKDEAGRLAVLDTYLGPMRAQMAAVLAERSRSDAGHRNTDHTVLATGRLLLTGDELRALRTEIESIWRRYEDVSWNREESPEYDGSLYMWSLLPARTRGDEARGDEARADTIGTDGD